ncbi:MAG: hypothetical protein AAB436_02885 [Patescibacteria group bacterium]
MINPPVNALTWTLGSVAVYVFAYKSWRTYKATKNPLAQIYALMSAGLATAFFFFGVPALLTDNTDILRFTYLLADITVQITLQLEIWLLWFLGLRNKIRLRTLIIMTSMFSIVLLLTEATTSKARISDSPHLVVYSDIPSVLIMKSIIYVGIAIPLGYFFLRQVPKQTTPQAKARLLLSALTFITLSLAATSNNIFDNGSDTLQSTLILAGLFTVLLIVSLLPNRKAGPSANRPTISR